MSLPTFFPFFNLSLFVSSQICLYLLISCPSLTSSLVSPFYLSETLPLSSPFFLFFKLSPCLSSTLPLSPPFFPFYKLSFRFSLTLPLSHFFFPLLNLFFYLPFFPFLTSLPFSSQLFFISPFLPFLKHYSCLS
jgi:hypothetical protein